MSPPKITLAQVSALLPEARDIVYVGQGGQKTVFAAAIGKKRWAVKFLEPGVPDEQVSLGDANRDVVFTRAAREVKMMQQCDCPHLVKIGPIGLRNGDLAGQPVVYYTEEFIEGDDLKDYLRQKGPMTRAELIRLGTQMTAAISAIWTCRMIHRDIKPGNIMRRSVSGDFVLLDMGCLFDLAGESLSMAPVGTPLYFSPEQLDFANRRRVLDFRSDLFALGVVLYEMATGKHPFQSSRLSSAVDLVSRILNSTPVEPRLVWKTVPQELSQIIMRLLAKQPALRYRKTSMLIEALSHVPKGGV